MSDPGGEGTEGKPEHEPEPVASGTLFIMILFLMALAGMWGIMFFQMLER